MSGFSEQWLQLREPIDARARSSELLDALRPTLSANATIRIVDLGAGTGANLRFLAPLIGGRQQWLLIDDDPDLLAAQVPAITSWSDQIGARCQTKESGIDVVADGFACSVEAQRMNLAGDLGALELPKQCLVTASALLDLVSRQWLERLIARSVAAEASCLFALTFDGRLALEPSRTDDDLVFENFNAHQRTDKGFGPALGPSAAPVVKDLLLGNGFAVVEAASNWRVEADRLFQTELVQGWFEAAKAVAPQAETRLSEWYRERRQQIEQQSLLTTVGHMDIAAWPAAS